MNHITGTKMINFWYQTVIIFEKIAYMFNFT